MTDYTVNPDGGATYTSASAWYAAVGAADLVTATEIRRAVCNSSGTADTTAFSISTSNTNASYYYELYAPPGSNYVLTSSAAGDTLQLLNTYTRVTGVNIQKSGTSGNIMQIYADNMTIDKCQFLYTGTTSGSINGIQAPRDNCIIRNSIIACTQGVYALYGISQGSAYSYTLQNVVIANWATYGIRGQDGTCNATNVVAYNNGTDFFKSAGASWGTSDYNASSDTSSSVFTNNVQSITSGAFVDAANNDYTPATSGVLDGAGYDLSGTFTTDLNGDTYAIPFPIGAIAVAAVADSTATFTYTVPATKKIKIREYHPTGGLGTTVPYNVLIDDVSKASGSIDQSANAAAFNTIATLTDQAAGSLTVTLNNTSSGGKVAADATEIMVLPASTVSGDFFIDEASNVAVSSHSLDYDEHGEAYISSGATVLSKANGNGVQYAAAFDYIWKNSGVRNGTFSLTWNPGSADNRITLFFRGSSQISDSFGYPRDCITITPRIGINKLLVGEVVDDTLSPLANIDYTFDNTANYQVEGEIDGSVLKVYLTENAGQRTLMTTVQVLNTIVGGYYGAIHGTYTNNAGRLLKMYAVSTDSVDSTAPGQVTGLTTTVRTDTRIDLSWTAVTGASYYKVFRDTVYVGKTNTTSYKDTGLTADTSYSYTVSAVDSVTNVGTLSAASAKTTNAVADSTAPDPVTTLAGTFSGDDLTITWTDSVSSDVEYVYVRQGSSSSVYEEVPVGTETYTFQDVVAPVAVFVSAVDYSGNESTKTSSIISDTVISTGADEKRDALLTNLSLSTGQMNDLEYKWFASLTSSDGHISGLLRTYLTTKGYWNGNLNQSLYDYLGGLGYTGSIDDRLHAAWEAGEFAT